MIVKVFSSSQWLNASKSLLEGDIITDLKLWKTPTTRTQEWGKQTSVYGTLSSVKMGVGSVMGVIFRHHSVLTVHRSISFHSKTKYICMHKKQRNLKSCRGVLLNTWPVSQKAEASLYRGVNQFSVTCDILMDSWTHTSVSERPRALECLSLRFISLQSFITGGLAAHLCAHTHTEWKSTRGKGSGNTSMKLNKL